MKCQNEAPPRTFQRKTVCPALRRSEDKTRKNYFSSNRETPKIESCDQGKRDFESKLSY